MPKKDPPGPQHWIIVDTNAFQAEGSGIFQGLLGTLTAGRRVIGYHLAIPDLVLVEHKMKGAPRDPDECLDHAREVWRSRDNRSGYEEWACKFLPMRDGTVDEAMARSLAKRRPFRSRDQGYRDTVIWLSILDFLKERQDIAHVTFVTNDEAAYLHDGSMHPHLIADLNIVGFAKERFRIHKTLNNVYEELVLPPSEKLEPMLDKAGDRWLPRELTNHCKRYLNRLVGNVSSLKEVPVDYGSEVMDDDDAFPIRPPSIHIGHVRTISMPRPDCWILTFEATIEYAVCEGEEDANPVEGSEYYDWEAWYETLFLVDWNPKTQSVRTIYNTPLVRRFPGAEYMCSFPGDEVDRRVFLADWRREFTQMARQRRQGMPSVRMR